jgi:hypothetical protein
VMCCHGGFGIQNAQEISGPKTSRRFRDPKPITTVPCATGYEKIGSYREQAMEGSPTHAAASPKDCAEAFKLVGKRALRYGVLDQGIDPHHGTISKTWAL